MPRWIRTAAAALFALLCVPAFVAPAAAQSQAGQFRFGPPPGMSVTQSRPRNGLQLRTASTAKMDARYMRQVVPYAASHSAGTVVVNTGEKFLYLVLDGGKALRYGIGVARSGFEWSGTHKVTRKAEWPGWTPPAAMRKRQPHLPAYMPGGPDNPLGARALYLGSTLYRIHGTNEPWSIGQNVSSGCIRMINDDVIDLYDRVKLGARVIVL
jgi:lipoprotein-anchoring transpeptidase ErfK/SrfK